MSPRGLAGTLRSPVRVTPARSNLTGRGASMSELVLIASHSSIWRTVQDRLPQVVPDRHRSSAQARCVAAVLSASVSRRGSEADGTCRAEARQRRDVKAGGGRGFAPREI